MIKPPASVLYRHYLADGHDEDAAVTRALADVDRYHDQLLHTLRDDIREQARCDALELRQAA